MFTMDWWPIIAASAAVLLIAFYRHYRIYKFFKECGIPYYKSVPVLGSMWKSVLQKITFAGLIEELYNIHSEVKYVGFFDFSTPIIAIRDLELVKSITVKHFEHFPEHRVFQVDINKPLTSRNLFNLRGERWKDVRTTLSPAFTSSKMKAMFVLMRECAKRYGDHLTSIPEDKRILELKDTFTRYTNDVIATCAFGINVDSMKDRQNTFYMRGRQATSFGKWQSFKFFFVRCFPWLAERFNISFMNRDITEFFKELVATNIKTRDEEGIVRPDVIQLMMETRGKLEPGKELSMEDMTAQAFIFFLGGFESASTLMCFAAYEVGVNEDVQRRLQDEIDNVLEACNAEVTYEAINDMKFLDAIINEALRMYPVLVTIDRLCAKPFELPPALPGLNPHVVKKGDLVWLPVYGIQHNPKYYPEPHKFNPDRFLNESKNLLNSATLLSFGMGSRMCIGNRFALLETKVLLFHIFAKCNFSPCYKTTVPMKLKKGIVMSPENEFWFDIQPRYNKSP